MKEVPWWIWADRVRLSIQLPSQTDIWPPGYVVQPKIACIPVQTTLNNSKSYTNNVKVENGLMRPPMRLSVIGYPNVAYQLLKLSDCLAYCWMQIRFIVHSVKCNRPWTVGFCIVFLLLFTALQDSLLAISPNT